MSELKLRIAVALEAIAAEHKRSNDLMSPLASPSVIKANYEPRLSLALTALQAIANYTVDVRQENDHLRALRTIANDCLTQLNEQGFTNA